MSKINSLSLIKKMRYGQLFILVRDNILAARYEEAMIAVDRMYELYGKPKPSENVKIQLNLIFGMVSWNLKTFTDVYNACEIALEQIMTQLQCATNFRSVNELKYLRAYCKTLVGFADAEGGVRNGLRFSEIDSMTSPDYDLQKVSHFLQRTFPVGDTSWWS